MSTTTSNKMVISDISKSLPGEALVIVSLVEGYINGGSQTTQGEKNVIWAAIIGLAIITFIIKFFTKNKLKTEKLSWKSFIFPLFATLQAIGYGLSLWGSMIISLDGVETIGLIGGFICTICSLYLGQSG